MLTNDEKREAFILATQSFAGAAARWEADTVKGLTDSQLAERLAYELGSFGGYCRTGLDVEYAGDGLKIWATADGFARRTPSHLILQGAGTIAYARTVYAIPDPADRQLQLF
jgi:hypothetical protein